MRAPKVFKLCPIVLNYIQNLFQGGRKIFLRPLFTGMLFYLYLFYLTANDNRPEPGVPSAETSCDNMIVKSQHIEAKKDTSINQ